MTLLPAPVLWRIFPLQEFQATLKSHINGLTKALRILSLTKNMKDKGRDKDKESTITDKKT